MTKKRGRPRQTDSDIHERKYYHLSEKRIKRSEEVVKIDRIIKAYEDLWFLAFGTELSYTYKESLKRHIMI